MKILLKIHHHFTPNDCATLWECIEETYEEYDCEDSIENMHALMNILKKINY